MWVTVSRILYGVNTKLPCNIRTPCLSRFLKTTNYQSHSSRTFFGFLRKPNAEEFKIRDNVAEDFKLIYRNKLDRYLYVVNISILFTAIAVVGVMVIEQESSNKVISYFNEEKKEMKATRDDLLLFATAFSGIAMLTNLLVQMLPIRIYYRPLQKQYIYIFQAIMPNSIKKLKCNIGQVVKLPARGLLPWRDQYYRIETENVKRTTILLDNYFRRPGDLHVMLGIQKDPEAEE